DVTVAQAFRPAFSIEQRGELRGDAAQAFAQVVLAPAEPDPQIPFEADVGARHDQGALLDADALGELDARHGRVVLHQRDRARLRLSPAEARPEAREPLAGDRQIVSKDLAGARVTALAIRRLHGDPRHAV